MATFPMKPAAGRAMGVTYKMVKLPAEAAPCVPTALQLVWFTDAAGTFSETSEAAYLLPDPDLAAGPVLAVAGIIGETCDAPVQWITAWAPEGTGGEPGLFEDGTRLVVWPKTGSGPGLLTVWAHIAGRRYGPINLTVLRYECAGYGYGSLAQWFDAALVFAGSDAVNIDWQAGPKVCTPATGDMGGFSLTMTLNAGYTLIDGGLFLVQINYTSTRDPPSPWFDFSVYVGTDIVGTFVSDQPGLTLIVTVSPPFSLRFSFPHEWEEGNLSMSVLAYGPG